MRLANNIQLDLFFTDCVPQQHNATETTVAVKGQGNKNSDSSFSSDESPETSHPRERQSPRTKEAAKASNEEKILQDLQKKSDNDNFWLTLSS